MVKNRKTDIVKDMEIYKSDIYKMLMCLGCNERTSAALMQKNEDHIRGWYGSKNGPIVTAQMSARLILRYESEENPEFSKNE